MPLAVEKPSSKIPSVGRLSGLPKLALRTGIPKPGVVVGEGRYDGEHQAWKEWLGKRVCISGIKFGTLLYYGKTKFSDGLFCGVCLDEPEGKHDGSVGGVRYFTCTPNHGVLAPPSKVEKIEQPHKSPSSKPESPSQPKHARRSLLSSPSTVHPVFKTNESTQCQTNGTKDKNTCTVTSSSLNSTFTRFERILRAKDDCDMTKGYTNGSSRDVPFAPLEYGPPLNVSFTLGQPPQINKNVRESAINRISEKQASPGFNSTFVLQNSPESNGVADKGNITFSIAQSPTEIQNGTFSLDKEVNNELYDIAEDDVDESSLGILTASQMVDLSADAGFLLCDMNIPKTQSCDDINELPEDEVVENVTVEYLNLEKIENYSVHNFTFDLNNSSHNETSLTPPPTSELQSTFHTSTPVLSGSKDRLEKRVMSNLQGPSQEYTDFQAIKKTLDLNLDFKNFPTSSLGIPLPVVEDASLLETQRLSCSFEDITVQTSDTSSLTEAVFEISAATEEFLHNVPNSIAQVLKTDVETVVDSSHSTIVCEDQEHSFTVNKEFSSLSKETELLVECKNAKWTNIVEELDHLNETLKAKLASGELLDLDPTKLGRVSIETVMEVIQREEMYKNRPASTYTVGSTDTGYQGDGECDGHSETAGSPCEEIKPLSICSQETDTDRMMKSGHMSDSDFFTDQGASSEMDLDGEMKQSISSLLSDGRPGDIVTFLGEEVQVNDAIPENAAGDMVEEEKNSSSAEGDQTIIEENSQNSKTINETVVITESEKNSVEILEDNSAASVSLGESTKKETGQCSQVGGLKESAQGNKERTGKANKILRKDSTCKDEKMKTEGKKQVKPCVSKVKGTAEGAAAKATNRTILLSPQAHQEPPKKIRSPRKGSKWDAVTSKIAAGLAEEKTKTKDRREIKSRVNTNLTGARQVLLPRRSDAGEGPGSVTYSSRTATDSVIHADISKGSGAEVAGENSIEIPRNRASNHPLSNAASPTTPSESSATSSSSYVSNNLPSKIAVPKRNFMGSQPLKSTLIASSSLDSKRPRPVKSAAVRPTPRELGTSKPAPTRKALAIKPEVVQPTIKLTKPPNACPPPAAKLLFASSKTSDASQSKPPKPTTRAPALSSRAAQSKIEELSVEVQRLGALCEQRTKELNMVKMQLKHTYCGFDAFAIMVNYLVGELDAFSHPQLLADMKKTREQLACSKKLLAQYEKELEYLKKQHSAEVQELANELSRTNGEVSSLTSQILVTESSHEIKMEEMERFRVQEIQQISSEHLSLLENMHQTHKQHTQDLESVHLRTLEETKRLHEVAISELLQQLEELKEKSDNLELQSKQFEETVQKDTDSKIQWIYSKNAKLIAEVDSLKSVMEMKQAEIHSLRKDNLELRKELEELPLAQKQIENLRARNEDLQAMIREKSKSARKLCQEKRQMKDICERVHKDNRRISMENEELQWKLQQTLDGSWSICSTSPDHDSHRRDNTTILSPNLSPWHEMEEDRLLPKSPINFYTLPVGPRSPQSASSSPGKSPTRPPSKTRQRHRSLGQPITPTEVPCQLDMSESMKEPELYFKACLQYEEDEALDQLFQASSISPKDANERDCGNPFVFEQNANHSSDSSMTSSLGEGSSLSSGEADQQPNEQNADTNFDLCSPRNLAGEAMVQDQNPSPASSTSPVANDSIFSKSTKTKRTPESETLPTLPNHVETPSVEVSSHGLPPTDSTNMDSSYGDDLGLESE